MTQGSEQVDALINLAEVEARLGDSKASAEIYERVLKLLPKEAEQRAEAVKFYASFEYFKQGVLEKGCDYYEGGFSPLVPAKSARTPRRDFDVPRWDGQPLNGKTLLVWREQGLGDELLFYTCLHELKDMGGKVIVECDKRLVEVMARSFPEFTIRPEIFLPQQEGRSPFADFDYHLPAGSLMRYFRPTIESFNRSGAYIKPDPAKVAKFEKRLAPYKDDYRLVGICWRSGKLDPVRNLSYTMLDEWGEVLQTPGFKFVNLQYGECEAELKEAEEKYGIEILRWTDLNLRNDLGDIFALMTCLDAVASVQTAVLVMAGAIGKKSFAVGVGSWIYFDNLKRCEWFKSQDHTSLKTLVVDITSFAIKPLLANRGIDTSQQGLALVRIRVGKFDLLLLKRNPVDISWYGIKEVCEEATSRLYNFLENEMYVNFIDIGANYGYISMIATKCIPGLRVICVEPDPRLAVLIRENFRSNRLVLPTVLNAIAGESEQWDSTFSLNPRSSLDNRVHNLSWEKVSVPTIKLSNHLRHIKEKEKTFIKIDTQGFEYFVIKGLIPWLKVNQQWVMKLEFSPGLLISQGQDPQKFLEYLLSEFECAELPPRILYRSISVNCLFENPLKLADLLGFIDYVENKSTNTLNGVDIILRPKKAGRTSSLLTDLKE